MTNKFRKDFLDGMTSKAKEIMNRLAEGCDISTNEILFLKVYLRELRREEAVPLHEQFIRSAMQIYKFFKKNFGGLFASGVGTGIDDYVINTYMEDN